MKYIMSFIFLFFLPSCNLIQDEHFKVRDPLIKKYVKDAVKLIKSVGLDEAIKQFDTTEWLTESQYIFILDMKSIVVFNKVYDKGANLYNVKNSEQRYVSREIIDIAKKQGSGFLNYKLENPASEAIESKRSYFEKVTFPSPGISSADFVVGSGYYY